MKTDRKCRIRLTLKLSEFHYFPALLPAIVRPRIRSWKLKCAQLIPPVVRLISLPGAGPLLICPDDADSSVDCRHAGWAWPEPKTNAGRRGRARCDPGQPTHVPRDNTFKGPVRDARFSAACRGRCVEWPPLGFPTSDNKEGTQPTPVISVRRACSYDGGAGVRTTSGASLECLPRLKRFERIEDARFEERQWSEH